MQILAAAEGGTRKIEVELSPALSSLSDEQIRALATVGSQVEALYKSRRISNGPSILLERSSCFRHGQSLVCFPSQMTHWKLLRASVST